MAWVFDKVFSTGQLGTTVPLPTADEIERGTRKNFPDMALDGKLLWVIAAKTVKCIDIVQWHLAVTPDEAVLTTRGETYTSAFVTVETPLTCHRIVAFDDKAYVTQSDESYTGSSFKQIVVVTTAGQIAETIKTPETMRSNLVLDAGKLWMTSYDINDNYQQELYWYDLTTKVWGHTPVPTRHQVQERFLACDHSGHILICDFNSLSITKFSNAGTYISTTRVAASGGAANREPRYITTDQNRNTYVSSFNGMISKMDTTADTFTMFSAGLGDVSSFADDGTHQWIASKKRASVVSYNGLLYECKESHIGRLTPAADPEKWVTLSEGEAIDGAWALGAYYVDGKYDLLKINRANQTLRHFSTKERDIQIEDSPGTPIIDTLVNKVIVSQPFTCSTKDGIISVPQYVWTVNNQCRVKGFSTDAMYRENFYEMKGFAMVSYGNYDYTGD